jgi:hypothetical protein
MTTSPDGEHVHVHNRLAEIHDRYGSGHMVSRSIRRATPLILEAVDLHPGPSVGGPSLRIVNGAVVTRLSVASGIGGS